MDRSFNIILIFISLWNHILGLNYKKNAYTLKHPASYLYSHLPQSLPWHLHRWSHHWFQESFTRYGQPKKHFLTWWPWPLTYDPDLRTWLRYFSTWPTCQNSGPYVCPFGRERGNTHTHRQTHRHTMSKLLHPSLTRGVKSKLAPPV